MIRVCASGATAANALGSKSPGCHGGAGIVAVPVSHGRQAAMKSSTGNARMYSPLKARSFFSSKNAGDGLTSPSRNSSTITSQGTISRSPVGAQPSSIR